MEGRLLAGGYSVAFGRANGPLLNPQAPNRTSGARSAESIDLAYRTTATSPVSSGLLLDATRMMILSPFLKPGFLK